MPFNMLCLLLPLGGMLQHLNALRPASRGAQGSRRVERQGSGVVGERLVEVPEVVTGAAPAVQRVGVAGVHAEHLREVGDRLLQTIQLVQRDAPACRAIMSTSHLTAPSLSRGKK